MSDHERGAYAPPTADAPLSFDPRQPVRGARPIPVTLILSVLVLAALVAAIFVFYQSGVRKAGQAPQVVGAPVDGIKGPAPAEQQPQDPAAGLQIYRSEAGSPMETAPEAPKFTNPPEQPQARPTTPVVVAQAPPLAPTPAPAQTTAGAAQALRPAIPANALPAPKSVTPMPPPVAKAAPTPAPVVELKKAPPPEPKKVVVAKAEPPKAETPKAPPAKPEPAKAVATSGGAVVQIGAVSSKALADKAWNDAVAAAPGLGAGKGKSVSPVEKNGGTLYRTAVTGFASKAAAQAFCAKLQAAGKSCFVR